MSDKKQDQQNRPAGPRMGIGMHMMMAPQKPKNFKGTFRRLLTYLRPYRMRLGIILIAAILSTVFGIVSPKILGKATTKLFEGLMMRVNGNPGAEIDFQYIFHIVLWLIALYLLSSLFAYVQQYLMAGVAQKTVYSLRKEVDQKLEKLPLRYYDARTHGDILSRVVNDVDTISGTLQQSLAQILSAVITIIGVTAMMLSISWLMTIILILTLPLSGIFVKMVVSRSQKHFKGQQKSLGELSGHVEEMYTGHKVVKAFGHERRSVEKFDEMNARLYDAGWRAQFMSGLMWPVINFIGNLGYVLVCVIGGVLVTRGSIAIGDVQAFIQYARQFSMPIAQTANIANIIQSTIAAAERVFEILDEEEESPEVEVAEAAESAIEGEVGADGMVVANLVEADQVALGALVDASSFRAGRRVRGDVRFEQVRFGYSADAVIIDDMNIDVQEGMTVAIVGPTGAGKTTIVNLLMRFYEVNEGHITIDGHDIRDMKRGDLRSLFGMVLQDTWLFGGTIRDNIAYGREGATEDEIVAAAQAAHADHFIRTLPDGYDTVLNEEASNISQGQKQLLTIARAVLADPAILILDEATSSVDTRTEALIQQAMGRLMEGRTSFVIAHRLSTIRDADLILVMNEGRVVEQGNHVSLLNQGGFYADLYNSQFAS